MYFSQGGHKVLLELKSLLGVGLTELLEGCSLLQGMLVSAGSLSVNFRMLLTDFNGFLYFCFFLSPASLQQK